MTYDYMEAAFNLDKVRIQPVQFDLGILDYLNSKHLRAEFDYTSSNLKEK